MPRSCFPTTSAPEAAEATLPDVESRFLVLAGLEAGATYELQLTSNYAPGAPLWRFAGEANDAGVIAVDWAQKKRAPAPQARRGAGESEPMKERGV